ncbi:TraR/DksA family transcriptional regulator [Polyangium mundeleinium]|uniref:TraR/DksA family transcriptional regulator n=1 Tax=Polyangium mundeleinium TaxID=2995306 RepID=A0ABT5F6G0_9BACT|nr:TraR/DksA family transcriptional regulator [Polyangium mundeleinium]MDC0748983.1 TraR/DksA family transcriptional regulator [Polyangium mundeleinium]
MDARKGVGIGSIVPQRPVARPATRESIDELPELTQEQREELRSLLETRRAEILASIETRQEQERDTGREVGDEMDEANIEGATAMASRLLERDVQLLSEIDRALAKFSDGTYGLCEGTGEPIGVPRLRSRPWARFSVEYQEQLEREARTRGGI